MDWGTKAQHMVLMPDGDVLFFDISSNVRVWDRDQNALEQTNLDAIEFISCAGHVLLPDGRVLVIAGTYGFLVGATGTFFFDPPTRTWSRGPDLHEGRYYPGVVTLTDGRVLVMSGDIVTETVPASAVEVLTPGSGETWTIVGQTPELYESYPRLFAQPDGRVVRTGTEAEALVFDPNRGSWELGPSMAVGDRFGGTAAWLPAGSGILALGGVDEGTDGLFQEPRREVEVLDQGVWTSVAPLGRERVDPNAVILPDGTIFVVGGKDAEDQPVYTPELYHPTLDVWQALAPHQRARMYHSTAVLLPDGRIVAAGGDEEKAPSGEPDRTAEVFSPPYLFHGPRPVLAAVPSEIAPGNPFWIGSLDARDVARVTMVRLGSVTHSVNFDQRFAELDFKRIGHDRLVAEAPLLENAPPGWYMLFLLSADGVPSEAAIVSLGA